MIKPSPRALLLFAILGLLICGTKVQSQVISVQFQGAGTALSSSTTAGFVPADNFNVLTGSSFTAVPLYNESGTLAATLSGGAQGTYNAYNGFTATGDSNLLSGELYDSATQGGDSNSITVSGLSGTYDVYVYGESDAAGRIETFAFTPTSGSTSYLSLTSESNATTYSPGTSTFNGSGTPPTGISTGNYVEFTNVSAASFSLAFGAVDSGGGGQHSAENGFQIVAVAAAPEPSTWAMLSLGLGVLLWQGRSRRLFRA